MDHALGVHVDDEEGEKRQKPDVVDLKEITRPDRMVVKEGGPSLTAMRCRRSSSAHIALDSALGDAHAELQQLAADSLRSPIDVLSRHPLDEGDDLGTEARFARSSSPGTPPPPELKSFAVPAKHSLGLHQEQGAAPPRNQPREQDEQSAFAPKKNGALDGAGRDDELLAEHRILSDELGARAADVDDQAADERRGPQSPADGAKGSADNRRNETAHPLKDGTSHTVAFAELEPNIKACSRPQPE